MDWQNHFVRNISVTIVRFSTECEYLCIISEFMKRLLYILLLPLICLASCRKSEAIRQMNDIETYIQTRPDSALAVLSQIDTSTLHHPKERAKYALLHSIALDKNYIDTTDIGIIRPAIEYYPKHGTSWQKMLTYYYEGRIHFNAQRDAEAIISQMHALDNAMDTEPGRYLGLIYSAMADLSIRSYCWEEAEDYLNTAQEAFLKVDDTIAYYLISEKILINRSNQGRKEEAIEMANSLMDNGVPSFLLADILIQKAGMMVDTTKMDYHPALACYQQAFQEGGKPSKIQLARYAYSLGRCGYDKEAEQVFRQLMESDESAAFAAKSWLQELLADMGDYQNAYRILRETLGAQSEVINQTINQSLFRTQRDYLKVKEDKIILRNKNQRLLIAFLVLSFILVAFILGMIVRHFRRKIYNKELEMDRFSESMKQILDEKEASIHGLQSRFKSIYSQRFRQLEEYYKDYEIARRSGVSKDRLYDSLLAIIRDIEGDTDGQRHLDNLIDQQYDGIMTRLHTECPTLHKRDYLLFSYTAAGFDLTTVGMLLGNLSADAVHMRRYRLRKALREINPPSLQAFLEVLDIK